MTCRHEVEETAVKDHTAHATVNPCTLCAPLGAVLAAAGVEGAMPLLHGAQGCATYIRRYLISHFREPIDVASSSFTEASAVFGGENEFMRALDNIGRQYNPKLVAVGTTCLAETIGEDIRLMVDNYGKSRTSSLPIVHASTPSYRDGHVEGFHAMVHSLVRAFGMQGHESTDEQKNARVNVLSPIISPADLRHIREIVRDYKLDLTLLPDYSETLDGPIHDRYRAMPSGGTTLPEIRAMAGAAVTIDFTLPGTGAKASDLLSERGVPTQCLGLPIGVESTDAFLSILERTSGGEMPGWLIGERGRLLDAYADGHKYVFGKRIAIYGDPELVIAVAKFLLEIGARPVLCATGARNRALSAELSRLSGGSVDEVLEDTDFVTIESRCKALGVELMIGGSKGYRAARSNGVPLLRLGFPIHDRIGASRILSLGYRGTLALFDQLVNALLQRIQDESEVGFSYL